MGVEIVRFDVYLVSLDPTIGTEIRKTRPCVVISPDEMNRSIRTIIVAPMTTKGRHYPSRIACAFQGRHGEVVLDQIRSVDRERLVRRLGELSAETAEKILEILGEMFAP